ncbi:hypothetical protein UPYG_G00119070 [Umbra pygmaea]|uniref:Tudor domain-containing protein n=1 Tax=Umbra pygmaea TaxID=75934 RepID=A0ABD0XU59_UMBPY
MASRLQSILSLAGVLAILGLWWYTSRKKRGLTDKDGPKLDMTSDRERLLCSSSEGRNDAVENGRSHWTDGNERTLRKRFLVEGEPVSDQKYWEAAAELARPQQPEGTAYVPLKSGGQTTESSAEGQPDTPSRSSSKGVSEKDLSLPSREDERVASDCGQASERAGGFGDSPAFNPHALENTTNSSLIKEPVVEVRGDPEGEVGEDKRLDKRSLHFAETRPQTEMAENCHSKGNLPILSVVEDPACESRPQDDTALAPLRHIITCQVASRQQRGSRRSPENNNQFEKCELTESDTLETNRLASGLISEMDQVLKERILLEQMVSSLRSGESSTAPDDSIGHTDNVMPQLLTDLHSTTGRENIICSRVIREDVKWNCSTTRTEKTELAGDSSGSSSGQYEQSSSSEDSSPIVSPPPPRGPAEGLAATSTLLANSQRMDQEAVSGSSVNSIVSEDSYFEHENQHRNSASPLSHLNADQPFEEYNNSDSSSSSNQTPTVWEMEVPKHLVGRLIGKHGRYVSYLKEMSGALVFISTLAYTEDIQICHVEGSKEQVGCAVEMIRKKFKYLDVTNRYAPPNVAGVPSLPITSWLMLPHRVTVEVTVILVASGNYLFLQQHTHPSFHALCSLDQQMALCYSNPGCPALPAPVEVGVICAAQMPEGAWWRAQVMGYHGDTREVELRYVDYGGYDLVKIDSLRQIRSDFVTLLFQGSEVILENVAPLPGEEEFSSAAKSALEDMTRGQAVLAQVTNCHPTGIPLVQIWRREGEELVSVNRALVVNGLCSWVDSP